MIGPANRAAWFGSTTVVPLLATPQNEVTVDGKVFPRARLDVLDSGIGRAPRATFSVGLGCTPQTGIDVRVEHAAPQIRPGALVRARLLRGGVFPGASRADLVVFEGRVAHIEMGLDPDGEGLRFEAEDLAAEVLRRRVGGQRIETAGGNAEHLGGLDLVFNPDGRPNAAIQLYEPGDADPYPIFAPVCPSGAVAWTLEMAVAYLLSEYAASSVLDVPSPNGVAAALEGLVIRDVRLEGRTLDEALDALLELVGGRLVVAVEPGPQGVSRRLELWLPERAPTISLAHQPVGAQFAPGATHLSALGVRMRFDAAPRRYVARGDRKCYESTFDLVPGWDDALASYDPDTFSPSTNPDFDAVRDVFRKWVLNEAGQYSGPPYDRGPPPGLSDLFESQPYVRRRRRLLGCLSHDATGRGHGVYVEVSLDAGGTWERLKAGAQVLKDECGLYLTDSHLPAEYLAAAMAGQVRVRVTATIESDTCLVAERSEYGAEALPGRTRYFSAPAGYRYRRVAPTSRFWGQGADEVDDSERLQALVDAAFEADRRCPAPSRIDVPYLALTHRVGQRVARIRGRRLDLARQHAGYRTDPVIRSIRFRFAEAPATELDLE